MNLKDIFLKVAGIIGLGVLAFFVIRDRWEFIQSVPQSTEVLEAAGLVLLVSVGFFLLAFSMLMPLSRVWRKFRGKSEM